MRRAGLLAAAVLPFAVAALPLLAWLSFRPPPPAVHVALVAPTETESVVPLAPSNETRMAIPQADGSSSWGSCRSPS